MAKESGRKKSPNQLRTEIARSRDLIERDLRDLRAELDFPRKIRKSFQHSTGLWVAAVVVIGVALAIRPARKKKVYAEPKSERSPKGKILEAGFVLGALRIAVTLFKPVIVKFVTQKVRDYAVSAHSTSKW
jgi:hypothetical protein